jgi:hypothetical protein
MNDKIYYIKENIINNNINHKIVYDFLIKNDIKYIKNMNGIFLTINMISDNNINQLYDLIKHNIHNFKFISNEMENYSNDIEDNKIIIDRKTKIESYKSITIIFNGEEKIILEESMHY